ncbi:MAG: glycosyltransferase family 39 protein [Magnetospirillum sp.]|nr:glycosyltransferase family 39 protein [Magnetospirillum sp.]
MPRSPGLTPRSQIADPKDVRLLAMLVSAAALVHLWLAGHTLLSGDEAYYWLWSRRLQLSYFDHPGMMAWWMAAMTFGFGASEMAVRLPAVIASALVTLLIFDGARLAFQNSRAGLWAAFWLNATILFGAAGVLVTPDSPLLVFWSLALWSVIRLLMEGRVRWLYVLGLSLGLGFASKYTMVLIAPGIVLTFVLFPSGRRWWSSPHFYAAIVLALLCTSPVLVWNAAHDWVSIRKQLSHSFDVPVREPLKSMTTFLATQVGVMTPLVFVFLLWGMGWALWAGWRRDRPEWFLLGATSAPVLVFFIKHSLGGLVQPHWPGPAYLGAVMAATGAGAALSSSWARRAFLAAPLLGAVMIGGVYVQMGSAALPVPLKADAMSRLGGWTELAAAVQAERMARPNSFVFATKHELSGLLSYYLPDHPMVFLTGSSGIPRIPSYDAVDVAGLPGRDGLFVVRDGADALADIRPYFSRLSLLRQVERHWGGKVVDHYDIWLAEGYRPGSFGEK